MDPRTTAPYVHPKLASADVRFTNPNDIDRMTDEELRAEIAELELKIQLAAQLAAEGKKLLPH